MPRADAIAAQIRDAFDDYHARFAAISRRAQKRFETRDWAAAREDATERLDLYDACIEECGRRLGALLSSRPHERAPWIDVRTAYAALIDGLVDIELYKTFYNTLTRRFFRTRGVDPAIEFVALEIEPTDAITAPVARHSYAVSETRPTDTFMRVLARRQLPALEAPRTYLSAIARGLVIDHWRRRELEQAWLETLAALPEPKAPSPEARMLFLEALVEIDRLLDALKPAVRTAFLLAQLDGLTCPEIARRLGVSRATAERYVAKALRACYALRFEA